MSNSFIVPISFSKGLWVLTQFSILQNKRISKVCINCISTEGNLTTSHHYGVRIGKAFNWDGIGIKHLSNFIIELGWGIYQLVPLSFRDKTNNIPKNSLRIDFERALGPNFSVGRIFLPLLLIISYKFCKIKRLGWGCVCSGPLLLWSDNLGHIFTQSSSNTKLKPKQLYNKYCFHMHLNLTKYTTKDNKLRKIQQNSKLTWAERMLLGWVQNALLGSVVQCAERRFQPRKLLSLILNYKY